MAQGPRTTGNGVNAMCVTASIFGAYGGLLGMEHGFFETLQGDVTAPGMRILAVGSGELPFPFGHEPAMTVIPNFQMTGIAALAVGLAIVVWSAAFVRSRFGAWVLFFLSVLLLFVGGGFGPISVLIAACIAAGTIDKPLAWWRRSLPAGLRRKLAMLWRWCLSGVLLYVPVEFAAGQIFHLENDHRQILTNLNLMFTYPMLGLIGLTLVCGIAHEIERGLEPGLRLQI